MSWRSRGIVQAILDGRQPAEMALATLMQQVALEQHAQSGYASGQHLGRGRSRRGYSCVALSFLCSTTSCRSLSMPSQVKAVVEVSSVVLVAFRRSTSWNVLRRNTGYASV